MKLVIDFVSNHTSRWLNPTNGNSAEDGRLYEPDKNGSGNYVFDANGNPVDWNSDGNIENLLANPHNDVNGWFHGLGDRGADSSRFGFRHKELGSLADFSQENAQVVAHLEQAAKFWKSKGIDGMRHDATLHMNPAFVKAFKDAIDTDSGGPLSHFGEFFIGRPDPKYDEYRTFPGSHRRQQPGLRVLPRGHQRVRQLLRDHDGVRLDDDRDQQRLHLREPGGHVPRQPRRNALPLHPAERQAVSRGHRDADDVSWYAEYLLRHGAVPHVREWQRHRGPVFMQTETAFNTSTTAYQVISTLAALRQSNDALAYGGTEILYSTNDVLVYKRQFWRQAGHRGGESSAQHVGDGAER